MEFQQLSDAYDLICNRDGVNETLQCRISIIQYFENEFGLDFKDTADLHSKIGKVLAKFGGADKLRQEREARGWSQKRLAEHLETSQQFVNMMEKGKRRLTNKALRFVNNNQN